MSVPTLVSFEGNLFERLMRAMGLVVVLMEETAFGSSLMDLLSARFQPCEVYLLHQNSPLVGCFVGQLLQNVGAT